MKINDEELREIFKSYILTKPSLTSQACPPSEEIAALFSFPGCGVKKEHIIDHIINCPSCIQEFDAFLQISRQEKKLIEEIDMLFRKGNVETPIFSKKEHRLARLVLSWRFILATTLTIFFVVVSLMITRPYFLNKQGDKRSSFPRSIELIEPRPGQIASKPLTFKWTEIEGRDYFIIEIFDEYLSCLWKSPKIFENLCHLPREVEKKLAPGRSYFWMITVYFPNGTKLESQIEELSVSN